MNNRWQTRTAWCGILLMLGGVLYPLALLAEEPYWVYTVRPGDTIWDLAERHTTSVLNWKRLQQLNRLPDEPALLMRSGRKLRFPLSILKHQPASAQIVQIQGQASLVRAADNSRHPVTPGMQLHSGDQVQTAADSNLLIRFADGSELLVSANSDLRMDSLSAYGTTGMVDTRIRLQGGQVDTQVQPNRGPGSRYEIITPAAVAAVRGTNFRVSSEHDQPVTRSEVLEGKVGVSGAGATQLVPAGFGLVAKAGTPPEKPRPLLPAPDLATVETLQQRLPLNFAWAETPKASAYRFQIAADAGFKSLLADGTTPTHRAFWKDLPDGDYVLRVRAIDADGLEGLNATQAFRVDARPEPPLLIGLVEGIVVRDATPEFGWSTAPDAQGYHLQVARDTRFTELLIDEAALQVNRYTPATPLEAGRYYWRMASIDAAGEQGPYSDAQGFEYKAIPDAPALEAPAISADELAFRWTSAGAGLRYHFQLAEDEFFREIVLERNVDEPQLVTRRPASRRYYFRVRAIDDSGYAGPFGGTQQIDVPPGSYWPLAVPLLMLLL